MQDELLRIWKATRKTVLLITHDVPEAVYLSQRVVVMSRRPGRIVEEFSVEIDRDQSREALEVSDAFNQIRSKIWLSVRRQVSS
jgi:NitT/TauT family transport system ATP-binding protein